MRSNKIFSRGVLLYLFMDFMIAMLSWFIFVFYRRTVVEARLFDDQIYNDPNFRYSILMVPVIWLMIYTIFDSYKNVYRMSRINEFTRSLFSTLLGSLFLFFTIILDDLVNYMGGYKGYYMAFAGLFLIHFLLCYTSRLLFLTIVKQRIKSGKVKFNTLIIGKYHDIIKLYEDIVNRKNKLGFNIIGYISTDQDKTHPLMDQIDHLGNIQQLDEIIKQKNVEEVILNLSKSENIHLKKIIGILDQFSHRIIVRAIFNMRAVLLGKVVMPNVRGADLFIIKTHFIPIWLRIFKRFLDLLISSIVLIILSPLYLFIALRVKLSSSGAILYKQERIGRYGKAFMIYKFRSMYENAEQSGPQLSDEDDPRVTKWGKTMRKYRLDELPQFWNVLIGDMSLVGPRPERQYYIDLIAEKNPNVHKLHKVRPGITSWGQVQYGYASNVEQMLDRLKLDLIYIENLTLGLDIKILLHTILVIVKGSGK